MLKVRLLVDNGLRERVGRYRLFGNVGFSFPMHQVVMDVVWNCNCERFVQHVESLETA